MFNCKKKTFEKSSTNLGKKWDSAGWQRALMVSSLYITLQQYNFDPDESILTKFVDRH